MDTDGEDDNHADNPTSRGYTPERRTAEESGKGGGGEGRVGEYVEPVSKTREGASAGKQDAETPINQQ